jgi:hypothetical protein
MGCILLVLVVSAAAVAALRDDDPAPARPVGAGENDSARDVPARTLAWLRESTVAGTRLAAPSDLRDGLVAALPGRIVRDSAHPGRVDLVLVPPGSELGGSPEWQRLAAGSVPIASFGSGFEVRQVLEAGTTWSSELAARTAAGRQLAHNDVLSFTPRAEALLRRGAVDPRLLTVLAGLALEHRATVDVPAAAGTGRSDVVRLAVDIIRLDGRRVADYPWGAATVKAFLTLQSPVFMPHEVALYHRSSGLASLEIRYPLPSPTGLLGGPAIPTTR